MFSSIIHFRKARLFIFHPSLSFRSHLSSSSAAAAAAANDDSCSATLTFLTNSCGLSSEAAASASRVLQLKSFQGPASVVQLFRDYGLSGTQIATVVAKQPGLLLYKVEKNLKPKLEFLHSFGFVGPVLGRLLAAEPLLLKRSLAVHLAPSFAFYKTILHTNQKVIATFLNAPRALQANIKESIVPAIQLLRQHGLPESSVSKLLVLHPGVFFNNLARVNELVEMVNKIGLRPSDPMFIHAYETVSRLKKPTWEKKMALYRSFGLSEDEIISAFRKRPHCMKISEKKIRQGMEFYVDRMKLNPSYVVANAILLMPSLEKTIKPRCAILSILRSRGKLKKGLRLISAIGLSNKFFLQRYVDKYQDDVPEVLKAYQGETVFKDLELN